MQTNRCSRRSKIILGLFSSLCIVGVVVGVATLALSSVTNGNEDVVNRSLDLGRVDKRDADIFHENEDQDDDSEIMDSGLVILPMTKKHLRRQGNRISQKRTARAAEGGMPSEVPPSEEPPFVEPPAVVNNHQVLRNMVSCESDPTNDTIPAAHIKGYGTKPFIASTRESSQFVRGFQQSWECYNPNGHAFVDGGMIFNQTDKSIRVPRCGYYHVFSQIYYSINDPAVQGSTAVYHKLNFKRNCPGWPKYSSMSVIGKSTVTENGVSTTTYTSDIVRLCTGGKIWVEIPDGPSRVPCCPVGDDKSTFIGAYFVAEAPCHWPPRIMLDNLIKD